MTERELEALRAVSVQSVIKTEDVWANQTIHVDGIHDRSRQELLSSIDEARRTNRSPVGVAILGANGTGKTHLLGWLRQQIQVEVGYFFFVSILTGKAFWSRTLQSMRDDLNRPSRSGGSQAELFVREVLRLSGASEGLRTTLLGDKPPPQRASQQFVKEIAKLDESTAVSCRESAQALAMLASNDLDTRFAGLDRLNTMDEDVDGHTADTLEQAEQSAQAHIRGISRLLALTGPSVLAIDQLDKLLEQVERVSGEHNGQLADLSASRLVAQVSHGLMDIQENTWRTLVVVGCFPRNWELIKQEAPASVPDRFRELSLQPNLPNGEVAAQLVMRRFEKPYRHLDFKPPYPTWPVEANAFTGASAYSPRKLLERIDRHIRRCWTTGDVRTLDSFDREESTASQPANPVPERSLLALDELFQQLQADAPVDRVFEERHEDTELPRLLLAGLTCWVMERGTELGGYVVEPFSGIQPALHGRLVEELDADRESERTWSFRGVAAGHGNAALRRLRSALTEAPPQRDRSRLILLRNSPWPPTAKKLNAELQALRDDGGLDLPLTAADIRVFHALRQLLDEFPADLSSWLVERQPATSTELLSTVLGGASAEPRPQTPETSTRNRRHDATPGDDEGARSGRERQPAPTPDQRRSVDEFITLGHDRHSGTPVSVPLSAVRKHIALFAGSGSGKTVAIRRLVEQCALHGVSAIVLDPNNDLARLGKRWPQAPQGWLEADKASAEDYFAQTEVVIWTPGREGGRPLSFHPLPNFAPVLDDVDELNDAIESAIGSLAPRAGIVDNKRSRGALAVLRKALEHFATSGESGLQSLIALLADLPDDIPTLNPKRDRKLAAELSESLDDAMTNDRLFGGQWSAVDPGMLLTPTAPNRARISVISFIGLPTDEQQQGFVNQLQMALFTWAKANPARDRPLAGLYVMDEAQNFAPAEHQTPCTRSTLRLASQARKYGLGLVFATQRPKGLHNSIPGNASTQFFGHLTSPTQIEVAEKLARERGSGGLEISRLKAGQFHVAREGAGFTRVQVPMCLSHHPAGPMTPEEVMEQAKLGPGSP